MQQLLKQMLLDPTTTEQLEDAGDESLLKPLNMQFLLGQDGGGPLTCNHQQQAGQSEGRAAAAIAGA